MILHEDHAIVEHATWREFQRGRIRHPKDRPENRVGTSIKTANGLIATCTAYRNTKDVDVKINDGRVFEHISWKRFIGWEKCKLKPLKKCMDKECDENAAAPISLSEARVGTTTIATNGMKMTCITHRGSKDTGTQFQN